MYDSLSHDTLSCWNRPLSSPSCLSLHAFFGHQIYTIEVESRSQRNVIPFSPDQCTIAAERSSIQRLDK